MPDLRLAGVKINGGTAGIMAMANSVMMVPAGMGAGSMFVFHIKFLQGVLEPAGKASGSSYGTKIFRAQKTRRVPTVKRTDQRPDENAIKSVTP